jgi:hypothetical protein
LLNLGNIRHLADAAPGVPLPGLIARLDWTTALGPASLNPSKEFRSCLVGTPKMPFEPEPTR